MKGNRGKGRKVIRPPRSQTAKKEAPITGEEPKKRKKETSKEPVYADLSDIQYRKNQLSLVAHRLSAKGQSPRN